MRNIKLSDLVEIDCERLSVPEVARELGLSARVVRDAVHRGELPCCKINCRTWKIKATDAALWFMRHRGGVLSEKGREHIDTDVTHGTYPFEKD